MQRADVAIVGGGIIGASIALELAAQKLSVTIFDRQSPGREASWAAAGMLSAAPDGLPAVPLIPLAQESLHLYPAFVKSVEEASGKDAAFENQGALHLFPGRNAERDRDELVAQYRGLGISVEPLSMRDARDKETTIGAEIGAAAWHPDEARVDPRLLTEAVLSAAQTRGVQICRDIAVSQILCEGNRCRGVLAGDQEVQASHVVIAAGSFCAEITGPRGPLAPIRPVRGQMAALRIPGFRLHHVLRSHEGYLVPRRDGRIVAGSTLENAGFEKRVTPAGLRKVLSAAAEMLPQLEEAEIVETWSGLRPGTPDELPILGPSDMQGLLLATGHYRNGILLAPVTAKLICEWIIAGKTSFDAGIFSPMRFEH
jgi:glycine oxidase